MSGTDNQKETRKPDEVAKNQELLPQSSIHIPQKFFSNSVEGAKARAIDTLRHKEKQLDGISTTSAVEIWKAGTMDHLKKYLPPDSAIIAKWDELPIKASGQAPAQLNYRKEALRTLIQEAIEQIEYHGVYINPKEEAAPRRNWAAGFTNTELNSGIAFVASALVAVTMWGQSVINAKRDNEQFQERIKSILIEYVDLILKEGRHTPQNHNLRDNPTLQLDRFNYPQDSITKLNNTIKDRQ